jgi:hypothetical protein
MTTQSLSKPSGREEQKVRPIHRRGLTVNRRRKYRDDGSVDVVMRTALVCALLALVPLSSLRIVCVNAHATGAAAAFDEAAAAAAECVRICTHKAVPHADVPAPATPSVTCLLVADPTCQFLSTATAAIMPHAPRLPVQSRAVRLDTPGAAGYLVPTLARHSPPPRFQA